MTDKQILERLGLTEDEASDLAQKMAGLSTAQAAVLDGATRDAREAAEAIGRDCSAADLQRFLDARKGTQPGAAAFFFVPQGDDD